MRPWLLATACLCAATAVGDPAPVEAIPETGPRAAEIVAEALPGFDCSGDRSDFIGLQHLTSFPGRRSALIFGDRRGQLYLTHSAGAAPTLFLDLTKYRAFGFEAEGGGLTGFALHPEFAQPGKAGFGRLYTAYSARADTGRATYLDDEAGGYESVIREWTLEDPAAERFVGRSRELFRLGQLSDRHRIGFLSFNPTAAPGDADYGALYAALGAASPEADHGRSVPERPQPIPENGVLRIDPLGGVAPARYGIPQSAKEKPSAIPELWVWNLEDPRHLAWDRATGALFVTGSRGVYELPNHAPHTARLLHRQSDEAIYSSGYPYAGSIKSLRGHFVLAEGAAGRLRHFPLPDGPIDLSEVPGQLWSSPGSGGRNLFLGEDSAGELYLLTQSEGCIKRLSAQQRKPQQ